MDQEAQGNADGDALPKVSDDDDDHDGKEEDDDDDPQSFSIVGCRYTCISKP